MRKFIYTSSTLLIILLLLSSFTKIYKKQDPKKQDPKKVEVKKIEDVKKILDTVKEIKTAVIEEKDSTAIYKGKFKPYKKNVHASYYADRFHGKRTASGRIFDMNKLTAAHKKLPFGTKVKVTNEVNGKEIIVEITDRGPFVKGREIDLSKKAFMAIAGNKNSGKANVTLEILQK